ncbi:cytochrome c oxidase subunit II [bacterium]|nr:cytochrome c oxidase subunit II [bacterium]
MLLGITAAMLFFVWRYRLKRNPLASNIEGNAMMEIVWTALPTALVMVMFWYGWAGYQSSRSVPPDAMPVKVTARMWSWMFEYANGKVHHELFVPLDKPVKLILASQDVNHSLYIPAVRIKQDCIPGRESYLWFRPTKLETYDIQCAEFCGTEHSNMLSKVRVVSASDFETWYNTIEPVDENSGERLVQIYGCLSCHTTDGGKKVGPSFKGIYGERQTVLVRRREMNIDVDDEYLLESMREPNAKIVKGYPPNQMPSQEGILSDEQMTAIVKYIQELK